MRLFIYFTDSTTSRKKYVKTVPIFCTNGANERRFNVRWSISCTIVSATHVKNTWSVDEVIYHGIYFTDPTTSRKKYVKTVPIFCANGANERRFGQFIVLSFLQSKRWPIFGKREKRWLQFFSHFWQFFMQ